MPSPFSTISQQPSFQSRSTLDVDVLQFLWGLPYNHIAAGYIESLRPSAVVVTTGAVTDDSVTWRVTVTLEKNTSVIVKITQEVSAGLPAGVKSADYLRAHLHAQIDPPLPMNPHDMPRLRDAVLMIIEDGGCFGWLDAHYRVRQLLLPLAARHQLPDHSSAKVREAFMELEAEGRIKQITQDPKTGAVFARPIYVPAY